MNARSDTPVNGVPPALLAEAGVWIARLHSEDRDPAMVTGVRQWLQSDPLHAKAFELCTEVWEESRNLRRVIPFATHTPRPRRNHYSFSFAAAVAVTVAAVAGLVGAFFLRPLPDVSTAVGEQRSMTLSDGTRVFLNPATHIVVRYDRRVRQVELKSGEALFQVAHRSNWPFIVQAGDRQVTALGTSFVVRRDEQRMAVTLVEGRVTVATAYDDGERIGPSPQLKEGQGGRDPGNVFALVPGQRLTFTPGKPAQLDTPSLEKTMAWRRGQVVLDDTPLSSAVSEMNRYNSIKLVIERPEAESVLVNGLFQAGDSVSFANALAETYELRLIERRGEIILSGAPRPSTR